MDCGRTLVYCQIYNIIQCLNFRVYDPCKNSILFSTKLRICKTAPTYFGGIFDFDEKRERLTEVNRELEQSGIWSHPEKAQMLGKERAQLEAVVTTLTALDHELKDAAELLEMAETEHDEDAVMEIVQDLRTAERRVQTLEFQRMFAGEMDANHAFLDIQAGSGGTEAQDWDNMQMQISLR